MRINHTLQFLATILSLMLINRTFIMEFLSYEGVNTVQQKWHVL